MRGEPEGFTILMSTFCDEGVTLNREKKPGWSQTLFNV